MQLRVGMTRGQYAARTLASQVTCPSAVNRTRLTTSRRYGERIMKWNIGGCHVVHDKYNTDCRGIQWRTQEFCSVGGRGGVQQIQLRTEDRENGDLAAVAP